MKLYITTVVLFALFSSNVWAASKDEKRQKIREMRSEVLAQLYQEKPSIKKEIKKAAGYAVFSNIGVNLFLVSAGGGSGIVHNNDSGKETFMKMGSAGVGIGLGVKDFRGVFIFHTERALNQFVETGWDFSGQADVAVKSDEKGAEENVAGTVVNGVSLYQMTKTGLALQATLQGTKYWKDSKLN